MRLQRLEKPENWSSALLEKIYSTIPDTLLQRYPDSGPFYAKLSKFVGVPEENIVVTSGIDEPIKSLITLCCAPGDTISVTWPGYAMYDVYARMFGVDLMPIIYDPYKFMTPDELIEKIPATTKILFLPNPSQPVENCFDLDQLRDIAGHCQQRDILFAVDEAYYFFGAPTAISLIQEYDNLLVMRTFSKAFGAASLRLGYVIGAQRAVAPLSAFRLAHEANALSLHAGSVLLDNFETFVRDHIDGVRGGRDYLRDAIAKECGLKTWGQYSNCVLVDLGTRDRMSHVAEDLKKRGIYIKAGFPAPMDNYLLITCGSKKLMMSFFDHFHAAWSRN